MNKLNVRVFTAAALLAFCAASATASSFVIPRDEDLIDGADAIVIATAVSTRSEARVDFPVVTVTDFVIERALKTHAELGTTFTITELGGELNDRAVLVPGAPRFISGERALLFMQRTASGWRTHLMVLGRFEFSKDTRGNSIVRRLLGDGVEVFGSSAEGPRLEHEFAAFIAARIRGEQRVPTYFSSAMSAQAALTIAPMAARNDFLMLNGGRGFRWQNPSADFQSNGAPAGLDGVGAVSTGMDMWNGDGSSNVNYSLNGTTTNNVTTGEGQNVVVYNDPNDMVSGTFGAGGGVLGVGFVYAAGTYTEGGETFLTAVEGDVVMNDGISSATTSQAVLNAALAHELGHTLGFRHSDEAGRTPQSSSAVMRSSISFPPPGGLTSYDSEAVQTVYGAGGSVCTPPSISTQPQNRTITSGQTATLSVGAAGTSPLAFQWFAGNAGNTSNPVGSNSSSLTVAPASTTSYWARVTGQCGSPADSAAATVTVNPVACTAPSISLHPQSVTINEGQSAILSVGASGTSPLTFQWFIGNSGDTSAPIGGNSSAISVAPSGTLTFWVRVSGQCGSPVNSNSATVTVNPAPPTCSAPNIVSQPQSSTVNNGQSVTLTVSVTGGQTPYSFQWFDGFGPIGGATSSSFNTGPLTQSRSFFVRVGSSCGTIAQSSTATITVSAPPPQCTAATIVSHPASRQVTEGDGVTLSVTADGTAPLSFQWFRGTPPGGTPLGGNSNALTFTATETASYWVKVSNACNTGVNSNAATITVEPACQPGHLCFQDGRFKAALFARDPRTGTQAVGQPLRENDLFGYFSIPALTGDVNNLEVFVKVLDGRAVTGAFWVFYGGLTDLAYDLVVTDNATGLVDIYSKPAGSSEGGFDTQAFTGTAFSPAPGGCVGEQRGTSSQQTAGSCSEDSTRLCLLNGRFRVRLTARDPRTGNSGGGLASRKSDGFGFFSIPSLTGQAENPEVFVKMIDARSINGFWVFFAGLTDFEYTVTITDMTNGRTRTYTKAANSACGGFDTSAFTP